MWIPSPLRLRAGSPVMVLCIEKLNIKGKLKGKGTKGSTMHHKLIKSEPYVMLFIAVLDLNSLFAEIKLHKTRVIWE